MNQAGPQGGEMSEDHRYAIGQECTTNNGWHLVVDFQTTSEGNDSRAYKNALKKAASLQNQVMLRSNKKNSVIYWEVWEYR